MEAQKTPNSQSNSEQKEQSWMNHSTRFQETTELKKPKQHDIGINMSKINMNKIEIPEISL
jgi:hypothetical protein